MCRLYKIALMVTALVLATISNVFGQNPYQSDETKYSQKILDNCKKSVFAVNSFHKIPISNPDPNGKQFKWQRNIGTAIPIDSQGHLVTLHSVTENAEKIVVYTENGDKVPAELVGTDATGFVSVLKIDGQYIKEIPNVISCHTMQPGDIVFFLGVLPGMSMNVRSAIVESVNNDDGTFEAKATAVPGTSGTPVFDKNENVLGLLAYRVDAEKTSAVDSRLSYLCISHEHASILAQQVISRTEPSCGWLGVCVDMKDIQNDGILVTGVIKGSPAERSNLKAQDRICEYNGLPIRTIREFSDAFTKTKAGEKVSLKVRRGESLFSVDVTLRGREN